MRTAGELLIRTSTPRRPRDDVQTNQSLKNRESEAHLISCASPLLFLSEVRAVKISRCFSITEYLHSHTLPTPVSHTECIGCGLWSRVHTMFKNDYRLTQNLICGLSSQVPSNVQEPLQVEQGPLPVSPQHRQDIRSRRPGPERPPSFPLVFINWVKASVGRDVIFNFCSTFPTIRSL